MAKRYPGEGLEGLLPSKTTSTKESMIFQTGVMSLLKNLGDFTYEKSGECIINDEQERMGLEMLRAWLNIETQKTHGLSIENKEAYSIVSSIVRYTVSTLRHMVQESSDVTRENSSTLLEEAQQFDELGKAMAKDEDPDQVKVYDELFTRLTTIIYSICIDLGFEPPEKARGVDAGQLLLAMSTGEKKGNEAAT